MTESAPQLSPHQINMIKRRYMKWCNAMKENNQSITDYFNINPPEGSNERLHISIRPSPTMDYLIMSLYYSPTPKYRFLEFPKEIHTKIYEYYKEDFVFRFKIDLKEYPFGPSIWSLHSFQYRFSTEYGERTKEIVEGYCKGIIGHHNCQNEADWSPAIMIDADILAFYTLINNYCMLIEKLKTKNMFNIEYINPFPI
jgi:hypothetical protein